MPQLKLKGRISKEKGEKISKYSAIILAVATGLYFLFDMGVAGLWISPWSWLLGIILTAIVMFNVYRSTDRTLFKKLLAFVLLCIIFTMPLFVVINVTSTQSTAQKLSTTNEVEYFKNLLGKSYNYTELIIWENQHLNFTYGNIERNDDPIKIYEYGKGRCQEFATLFATLCISQGYRCRIVDNILNDHVFNEVLLPNGTWTRVDASLNPSGDGAVGNPMFFETAKGWGAPILSLAFENSTIVEVTSTYRSDKFAFFSPIPVAISVIILALMLITITRLLILPKGTWLGIRHKLKRIYDICKNSKLLRYLAIVEVPIVLVFAIAFAISFSFPDYIKVQGTIDLLKALVEVDGIILGFVGIVYAQLFTSIMDQQNTLFAKMLTNLKLYSRFENYLNEYSARRNMLIVATVATFATLLSSIISALINLARVSVYDPIKDTYAPFGLAFFPLFFLVEAIIVLVIALVGVPMGIPKQMKGQIQTTLQQSPKE